MLGAGIAASDLTASRSGNHLVLKINDANNPAATDQITIENWWVSSAYRIESFQFADGSSLSANDLNIAPSGLVTISGSATQNQVLTASNTLFDENGLGTISYQWLSSSDGTTWTNIGGATANTFTLTESQVGKQIRVNASYTDGHGFNESMNSAATVAVANVNDVPTGSVTISGTAAQNQVLSAANTLADADGLGSIGYQWQSSSNGTTWSDISGATGSTFTLAEAQVGKQVKVTASYTDGHGSAESSSSSATAAITNVNDSPTGSVTVSGTATQNQVLTASNTLADADGLGTIGYQWQSSSDGTTWSNIGGATASTFTLTEAEVNKQVRVNASYTDGHGTTESLSSSATETVANVNDSPAVSNAIADQSATAGATFSFVIPSGAFSDPDAGDTLNYVLTKADGSALPSWLSYDTATRTLSGTPGYAEEGLVSIKVVVTDGGGLQASDTFDLTVTVNTFTGTSGNDSLTGTAGVDKLLGLDGNDTLNGGTGADNLIGGNGNDTYVVDDIDDAVTENAGEGTDLIQSSIAYTLGNNVENLTLIGSSAINGTGNTLNNTLTGNSASNVLDGGTGADTLTGGAGDDTYVIDNAGDVVTENANEGTDTIQSSVTYILSANVENLTLTGATAINGTGNALDNVLTGNSATNTLTGGAGNDTYVIQNTTDIVVEAASAGTDTIQSSVTYTLSANVENLTLTGATAINGTGNTLDNILTGNTAANALSGGAGNDTLDGGAGADTMTGGTGNDTYVVDNAADVVMENASGGTDTVQSSITYTLGSNVENLTLTGSTAINGTGNTLSNILTGNSAANTLSGGTGADTMIGGQGNDIYVVDNTGDVVTENSNEGSDTIQSSVTYTLSANVENLTLTGATAINGTGNTLDNVLTGNSGANTLTGNAGNDTLDGGAGADSLMGGTGNDTYLFGINYGADTVTENDATAGNTDLALFGADIADDQLWFRHVGNNLEVSIIGTPDKMTIQNWYTGSANHVEQFKTIDGNKLLLDTSVESLVSAMAAFSPPAAGQTTLPPAYQTVLEPVIAANWH